MLTREYRGFTLIELLVVVTIIVVLLALLTPALDKAIEQANIAVCGSHLKGIGQASVTYALENKKQFIICRGRTITQIFSPAGFNGYDNYPDDAKVDWLEALATVGLAASSKSTVHSSTMGNNGNIHLADTGGTTPINDIGRIWDCPSRNYKSGWDSYWNQMPVNYQYFGGVRTWRNPSGDFPARSPVSLSTSGGNWALAADMTARLNHNWGDDNGNPQFYADIPAHKAADGRRAAGGNNGYVDGSVAWYPFDEMVYIHFYLVDASYNIEFFWHQSELGEYNPPEEAQGRYIKD